MSCRLAVLIIALSPAILQAQAPGDMKSAASLQDHCASNPCRQNVRVKLRTDGATIDDVLPYYWPVIQGNRISILPGEKLFIEAVTENGRLTLLRQVESIGNPEKTLTVEFTQSDDSLMMLLTVRNPFHLRLKYHIDMIDFSGKPHQTSSCPVVANGSVYESWPHPIPELRLSDLRLLTDSEEVACTY